MDQNKHSNRYFDRDISWLKFNERVLEEAAKVDVPLFERLKFLAIYSSNLDEFYRVRMASIMALSKVVKERKRCLDSVHSIIRSQQDQFGDILRNQIMPELSQNNIELLYNVDIPPALYPSLREIFYNQIAGFLHVEQLTKHTKLFPENNKLYLTVSLVESNDMFVVNIPSDSLSRFYSIPLEGKIFVVIIDDIICHHVSALFGGREVRDVHAFKVTRDAEMNPTDEMGVTPTDQMEKLLAVRDLGFATRLLYGAAMPEYMLRKLVRTFKMDDASHIAGGRYHNLRDFFSFPKGSPHLNYDAQRQIRLNIHNGLSIFDRIDQGDVMLHTPYHSYDMILRFFNEAAIDPFVEKIYVTLYRIATDSAIAHALISAAKNGKKVYVLVELKARFDEANNLRWSSRMKEAGVKIMYSGARMKVHAKTALVTRRQDESTRKYGLFATGNFNENTARVYTDHILFTSNTKLLSEAQLLFKILIKNSRQPDPGKIVFKELIVAPFNIRESFFALIDHEIESAQNGRQASIIIKMNNLEEETLIDKLYEASAAGVQVQLIVRSICRLIPQQPGLSENITVRRIIDRYLEHGRVFIFHNGGDEKIYCGSADWMNRNIYHRIEVCFPIFDAQIRSQLLAIIKLQLRDNAKAVMIDQLMNNVPISNGEEKVRSQSGIYDLVYNQ
ncbi:polyphosphate kinase 1 [Chryseolinea sp. T2]|uniref:polyphosphate kinase 1 n=1 Tax=Chryseolinea sp. T2 TaxID=3129255 RepID=UPI0030778BDA